MHVLSLLLSLGPNDVHKVVDDAVVGGFFGFQLLPEQDGGGSVLFEAHGGRDVVLAAPEAVHPGRGPVPSVVIRYSARRVPGRSDHYVRAVHRVEVVPGRVRV